MLGNPLDDLLDDHPATKFAERCLRSLDRPLNGQTPLVALTMSWIEDNKVHPDFLEKARDWELEPPAQAASQLVPNYEQFHLDLGNPDSATTWDVLSKHLDELHGEMQRHQNLHQVGKGLAENLYSSLAQIFPSFAPRLQ